MTVQTFDHISLTYLVLSLTRHCIYSQIHINYPTSLSQTTTPLHQLNSHNTQQLTTPLHLSPKTCLLPSMTSSQWTPWTAKFQHHRSSDSLTPTPQLVWWLIHYSIINLAKPCFHSKVYTVDPEHEAMLCIIEHHSSDKTHIPKYVLEKYVLI